MIRRLRHLAAHFLPEAVKAQLRGRFYGYRAAGARVEWRLEADWHPGLHRLIIGSLPPLVVPDALLPEIRLYLEGMGESVEEVVAFLGEGARAPGGVLFDVGAHQGLFSWLYCAARPDGRAFAFEPAREPGLLARQVAGLNGMDSRLTVVGDAVGAAPGSTSGWVDDARFFRFGTPPIGFEAVAVPVTSVDAEAAGLGEAVSILKVDVEGYEHEVLLGARQTLRSHRPVVFLELHLDLLELAGGHPAAVLALLEEADYRFETLLGRPLPAWRLAGSAAAVTRFVARPR
jgi:FkbM family methyltransferase